MKRFGIACFILVILLALNTVHGMYVHHITDDLIQSLEQVNDLAHHQAWGHLQQELETMDEKWEKQRLSLMLFMDHENTDGIALPFQRMQIYAQYQEQVLFLAECNALLEAVRDLQQDQRIHIENLF